MPKVTKPEPLLYLSKPTAAAMGLKPEDIVTESYAGKYVFLHDKSEVLDLRYIQEEFRRTHRGKQGNELDRPIVTVGADGVTPTLMIADNMTEAEEVQDIMGMQLEKQEKQMTMAADNNKSPVIDTDWIRHVNHLPIDIQQRRDMISQAIRDRMDHHKQNPITDKPRDPWAYAREIGQIPPQVQVPSNYEVTDDSRGQDRVRDSEDSSAV